MRGFLTGLLLFFSLLALPFSGLQAALEQEAEPSSPLGLDTLPSFIREGFASLSSQGITPFASYVGVVQGNPVGGESRSVAYSQETLFGATFDLEKILAWPGATWRVSGSANSGRNLSQVIPNTFNVSQAYVTPTVLLYEIYLAQRFFQDRLEVRIGRMTSADWFASLPAFGLQVQGGIDGNPTALFLNSAFTSSPNATWAATGRFLPTETTYAQAGIFQATDRLGNPAYHGVDFSIRRNDGLLFLGEVGWKPTLGAPAAEPVFSSKSLSKSSPAEATTDEGETGLPGVYKAGAYFSTFPQAGFLGGGEQNTYGLYAMAQQRLWRDPHRSAHGFSLWGGATYSPQIAVAQMPVMGFAGAIWHAPIPGREEDQLLFLWLSGSFSRDYRESIAADGGGSPQVETVFELSYVIQLTQNLFIQPDLQLILQPNGLAGQSPVLVPGLQFGCTF